MKFKNIKLKNVIIITIISFLYPVISYFVSDKGLIIFIDSLTIISFVDILIGLVYSFIIHGDFDITQYYLTRRHKKNLSFDAYKSNKDKEREDSFNYLLFLGIIYLLICIVLTNIFY